VSDRKEIIDDNRRLEAEWHTRKYVANVDEQKALAQTTYKVHAAIKTLGLSMGVGTYIPYTKEQELQAGLDKARALMNTYNASASRTAISGGFLTFRITGENEAVANALLEEATSTLRELERSIAQADVKAIRATLTKVKRMDDIFVNEKGDKLKAAFAEARVMARRIVKASKQTDEEITTWADKARDVEAARIAFAEIDVDETAEIRLPAIDFVRSVEGDFDDGGPDNPCTGASVS
jgi:hypothetical protein